VFGLDPVATLADFETEESVVVGAKGARDGRCDRSAFQQEAPARVRCGRGFKVTRRAAAGEQHQAHRDATRGGRMGSRQRRRHDPSDRTSRIPERSESARVGSGSASMLSRSICAATAAPCHVATGASQLFLQLIGEAIGREVRAVWRRIRFKFETGWRVEASFGVIGFVPLWLCDQWLDRVEADPRHNKE
jgi:hypothetical protein